MKIWRCDENTDDKVVAFINQTILKCNPENSEIDQCINDLRNGLIPSSRNIIEIPLSYIKEIHLQEGKKYIEILFGRDSSEHLKVNNDLQKVEIFNYLKENIPNTKFFIDKYSKLRAGKKPLIAMAIVMVIFLYTLYYAIGYDEGKQYEISNGHYNSITGIVLAIASYGVKNVVLVFGSLFAIALFSFIKKVKTPPVINLIKFDR